MSSQALPRWDRQMQRRLARGEESALGELYDRFASMVHHLANKIVDDRHAAEQITREVFVRIWEHPDAFDPKRSNMRSWVALLTHREAVARLRGVEYGDECSTADAEAKVHAASTAARADYIVSSMPEPLRRALRLTHNEGRTYRQAAVELGVSESEARSRVRLGLQLLSTAADDPEGRT
jgi:RNA polymerase sigma-70 factor (ECF subfamily)